jgi:two-component system response regulator AtoC
MTLSSRRKSSNDRGSGRRLLVVDDAEGIRTYLANLLELRGYQVDTAEDGRSALALLEGGAAPDAVILDVMMPGIDGIETLRRIRDFEPELPVVMLSVVGRASTIVGAMQLGAVDYVNKPFDEPELEAILERCIERRRRTQARDELRAGAGNVVSRSIWESDAMRTIQSVIEQISETDVTVLIEGESGVGKEIVARSIHARSSRSKRPFVKVNCAALPEDLLESELFGYEKGAFTGAYSRKPGRFELANTGTIFLDEIGEMSPILQAKMLHVMQDSVFTRLGGHEPIRVDVQILSATNRPLVEMVARKQFREDLYFRLNVVSIGIPPLRERRDEIPKLVESFLARYSIQYGRPRSGASEQLLRSLERYDFPGNIRELENMMKRIVVLESEDSVLAELAGSEAGGTAARSSFLSLLEEVEQTAGDVPLREVGRMASRQAEREAIERSLHHTSWNRKQAAKLLNVSYKTLLLKIRECGLTSD